jgi:hypothetical protein
MVYRAHSDRFCAKGTSRTQRRRRGMALLMVLLLLSLTLGLSYAAMRSQSTAGMIQRNSDRRAAARQAAITGLSMALKKMHRNDWSGVDTSLSGTLSSTDTFLVTYTSGDTQLPSSDSDQPYRVTLLSSGYSADPVQVQSIAMYRVRSVVRLIPRKLADEPPDWKTMVGDPGNASNPGYTVYQWTSGTFTWDPPARIEGPVRMQATFFPAWFYSWLGLSARTQFLSDLNAMRLAGRGDYRPFNAQISLRNASQAWDTLTVLNSYLGVSTVDMADKTVTGMTFPSALSTYRLYPGGKAYTIPQLPRTLQAANKGPDVTTNPAGLFCCIGALDVYDDTTISGTVFTTAGSGGRLTVSGKRVHFNAVSLPPLQGTTAPVQLPAAVVADDFRVSAGADLTMTGLVAAYYGFEVVSDNQAGISLLHQGRLIAQDLRFDPRNDWNSKSSGWWNWQYNSWYDQRNDNNGYRYFPEYLQKTQGLNPSPQLNIKPEVTPVRYHWHNPQNTIYVTDPSDGGLRWDLLSWMENV